LSDMIKGITAELAPGKKKAHEAHKWFTTYEATKVKPLTDARVALSKLIAPYLLEKQRLIDEANKQAQLKAIEDARAIADQDKETRVAELLAEGKDDEAGELMVADTVVDSAVVVRKEVYSKPAGVSIGLVKRWSAEVYDIKKLIAAVAAGTVEVNCLMVDQKYLDGQAVLKKSTMDYPGVRAIETAGTSR
jgi:hypothetical protein